MAKIRFLFAKVALTFLTFMVFNSVVDVASKPSDFKRSSINSAFNNSYILDEFEDTKDTDFKIQPKGNLPFEIPSLGSNFNPTATLEKLRDIQETPIRDYDFHVKDDGMAYRQQMLWAFLPLTLVVLAFRFYCCWRRWHQPTYIVYERTI